MSSVERESGIPRRYLLVVQILIVAFLAIYIAKDFNVDEFLQAVRAIDPEDLLPIVLFEVLYYLSNSLAFWFLCRKEFRLRISEAFGASMMSWLVDILLPSAFIEGDLARVLYLKTRSDWAPAISHALFFRFLISSTLVFFILFTSLMALNILYLFTSVALLYFLAVLLGIALSLGMWVVVFKPTAVGRRLIRVAGKFLRESTLRKLENDLGNFLAEVERSSQNFRPTNPDLLAAIAFLMLQWVSGIMTPYYSLRAVGVNVNPIVIGPGYTILTVFSLASIGVPFMVGSIDSALVTLYILLGVPKERALAAAVLGRSITIIASLVMIYPVGIAYIRKTFSTTNLEEVRETLRRISAEYSLRIPFISQS